MSLILNRLFVLNRLFWSVNVYITFLKVCMEISISLAILVRQFWKKMEWSSENENQGMQNEKATIFIR